MLIASQPGAARRSGFTILEMSVALAVLITVMLMVVQVSYWSITNRLETVARQLALEHANNILEAARATPYEKLDDKWATKLDLPEDTKPYLPEGKLGVKVEPEPKVPGVKRVTVEISWSRRVGVPHDVVKLIALFGAAAEAKK